MYYTKYYKCQTNIIQYNHTNKNTRDRSKLVSFTINEVSSTEKEVKIGDWVKYSHKLIEVSLQMIRIKRL